MWCCLTPSRCGPPGSLGTKESSSASRVLGFLQGTKLTFQPKLGRWSRDPFQVQ